MVSFVEEATFAPSAWHVSDSLGTYDIVFRFTTAVSEYCFQCGLTLLSASFIVVHNPAENRGGGGACQLVVENNRCQSLDNINPLFRFGCRRTCRYGERIACKPTVCRQFRLRASHRMW